LNYVKLKQTTENLRVFMETFLTANRTRV